MVDQKIYIFALAAHGKGISGSDRIFIEFARRWNKKIPVTVFVWDEGYRMCLRQGLGLSSIKYQVSRMLPWKNFGFFINYIARIIEGVKIGLTLKIDNISNIIIYSASEFWMDSLPVFILKLRCSETTWVAAWFQTAPKPWIGFTEGKRKDRYYFRTLIYWLIQQPIKRLISDFADFVLVNNEDEKKQFPELEKLGKAIVVQGAVDLGNIKKWQEKLGKLPKKYDAVFQGRFHPQKGVMELIDIWKIVVHERPKAKLILIGDGPLMKSVKSKVQSLKLGNNIKLTGYLFDGPEKYRIFCQSKLVVHPAFYDSGGMAAAEVMAFGLPGLSFNLKSSKLYYPKGMLRVPLGNLEKFAAEILRLLSNSGLYRRLGSDALKEISKNWSWQERADSILNIVLNEQRLPEIKKI